ncbi:hypothetical protein TeGR_g10817 [Tetraparma gracilis]|uniref:GOLD domain-containing protein n=1 Tax=Tetraparma gracilis TaxID=2962635 RepID=A0ABQ6N5I7_9STRA|nr:hypothetical protein TeGR_g10817 [Tetraparma gracilis]
MPSLPPLLPLLLLLLLLPPPSLSWIVHVPASSLYCLTLHPPPSPSWRLAGNFDVLSGSPDPVTAVLLQLAPGEQAPPTNGKPGMWGSGAGGAGEGAPPEVLWQSGVASGEGTFALPPPDPAASYSLCVQNGAGRFGVYPDERGEAPGKGDGRHRKVGLALAADEGGAAAGDAPDVGPAKEKAVRLLESVRTLTDHQSYMRQRASDHRDLVEVTNSRVVNWRIGEGVFLLLMAGWQMWNLKRFFEQKRML